MKNATGWPQVSFSYSLTGVDLLRNSLSVSLSTRFGRLFGSEWQLKEEMKSQEKYIGAGRWKSDDGRNRKSVARSSIFISA